MTIEESKAMWEVERNNVNLNILPKEVQKLYKLLDKVIEEGIITYEDFTNDTIDELTTMTIENTKNNEDPSRQGMIEEMAKRLYKKYEDKYKNRESIVGDERVQENTTEVPDGSGVCESECTEAIS